LLFIGKEIGVLKEFRLCGKYMKINILSNLEYKGWWMMCVSVAFYLIQEPLFVFLMFSHFGSVGEWSVERIILVYSLAATSYGTAKVLCTGFEDFPWDIIRSGDFDRFLLRPPSLFTQIIGARFRVQRIPWAVTGMLTIMWALYRLEVPLNAFNLMILFLSLAGGFLFYTGAFILTSGIAIFTVKGLDWIYLLTCVNRQITKCPADYMPKILRSAFTFFIPMLVISYYPAAAVCGWGAPLFTGFLALPAGIAFMCISLFVWKIGVRHYKSTGS